MEQENNIVKFREDYLSSMVNLKIQFEDVHKSFLMLVDSLEGDKRDDLYSKWNLIASRFNQIFEKL